MRTIPPPSTPSELLVAILAEVDALFIGPREYHRGTPFNGRAIAEIQERRTRYLSGDGIRLAIGGDAAARKAGERLLDQLVEAGAVVTSSANGRRCGVALTAAGDAVARQLVAAPGISEGWSLLHGIEALEAPLGLRFGGATWLRETDVADLLDQGIPLARRLVNLEFLLLPLKACGLVTDNADCDGRLCYSLTADGRAAANDAPPATPRDLTTMDSRLADRYSELLPILANERASWRCDIPGRLHVPLPVTFPEGSTNETTARTG